MPVFALWSAPRARSTAFFRSMLERGDLLALHEPLEGLMYFGDTEVEGRTFESPASLLAWLRDETHDVSVFLKETTDDRVRERRPRRSPLPRRGLARVPHSPSRGDRRVLVRVSRWPDMRIEEHRARGAARAARRRPRRRRYTTPVVIDSDDLVARPESTMAAYCAAVGLPFIPQALTWEPGERPEWRRSARWHKDVSASSGFEPRKRRHTHTVETSDELARFAAYHLPFYEQLHPHRLDVAACGPMGDS